MKSRKKRKKRDLSWKKYPKGWTDKSFVKYVKSLTGGKLKGMFTRCFERIRDEKDFDDDSAKRFCAAMERKYKKVKKKLRMENVSLFTEQHNFDKDLVYKVFKHFNKFILPSVKRGKLYSLILKHPVFLYLKRKQLLYKVQQSSELTEKCLDFIFRNISEGFENSEETGLLFFSNMLKNYSKDIWNLLNVKKDSLVSSFQFRDFVHLLRNNVDNHEFIQKIYDIYPIFREVSTNPVIAEYFKVFYKNFMTGEICTEDKQKEKWSLSDVISNIRRIIETIHHFGVSFNKEVINNFIRDIESRIIEKKIEGTAKERKKENKKLSGIKEEEKGDEIEEMLSDILGRRGLSIEKKSDIKWKEYISDRQVCSSFSRLVKYILLNLFVIRDIRYKNEDFFINSLIEFLDKFEQDLASEEISGEFDLSKIKELHSEFESKIKGWEEVKSKQKAKYAGLLRFSGISEFWEPVPNEAGVIVIQLKPEEYKKLNEIIQSMTGKSEDVIKKILSKVPKEERPNMVKEFFEWFGFPGLLIIDKKKFKKDLHYLSRFFYSLYKLQKQGFTGGFLSNEGEIKITKAWDNLFSFSLFSNLIFDPDVLEEVLDDFYYRPVWRTWKRELQTGEKYFDLVGVSKVELYLYRRPTESSQRRPEGEVVTSPYESYKNLNPEELKDKGLRKKFEERYRILGKWPESDKDLPIIQKEYIEDVKRFYKTKIEAYLDTVLDLIPNLENRIMKIKENLTTVSPFQTYTLKTHLWLYFVYLTFRASGLGVGRRVSLGREIPTTMLFNNMSLLRQNYRSFLRVRPYLVKVQETESMSEGLEVSENFFEKMSQL